MSFKTNVRHEGNAIFVEFEGLLDFETADQLRRNLEKLCTKTDLNQVVFDLRNLHFVGSSGISAFIQMLREFNDRAVMKPKYVNVKSEFKRLFAAFDESGSFELGALDN